MTVVTTIQATQVLWDKTADKLYVWDDASGAWELFFVAADLVTNDALTDDLALKVDIAGDTMTGTLEAPGIGINTAPDSTNKLSVKSNAALLAALESGSGGTGDIRTVLSKQAAGNTASFLYQDNFSGRAEIGLCGDDNFHFKVSPDGSTFHDGIVLDKSSGQATFLTAPNITGMTAGSIPFFGPSGLFTQDNAKLFWDETHKRLGIGTATPQYAIDLNISSTLGGFNDSNHLGSYTPYDTSGWSTFNHYWASGSTGYRFQENGATLVTITNAGKVGIGITTPAQLLDVSGGINFRPASSVTPINNGDVGFEATSNTSFKIKFKGSDGTVRAATLTLS